MTTIKLPFVHEYRDRHGKLRRYVRLPGRKRVALKGEPGSREFMEAYQAALDDREPPPPIGASKVVAGTIHAAVSSYLRSAKFEAQAAETQRTRRNILERFREAHGDKRVAKLQPHNIDKMIADKAKTPFAARNFRNTLRALLDHCVLEGMRPDNPAKDTKVSTPKTSGFRTWSEEDIELYESRHAVGTRARLALALLLYTAARRSDVVRLGRQHIRDGQVRYRQKKTGMDMDFPVHPELAAVLAATPSKHLTFLVTAQGNSFTGPGFTNWFRDMCRDAGLPKGLSAHGLRKAQCRRLGEAGCSELQIAAISGHESLSEVRRYTRAARKSLMAKEAMAAVASAFPATEAGTPSGYPKRKVSQNDG